MFGLLRCRNLGCRKGKKKEISKEKEICINLELKVNKMGNKTIHTKFILCVKGPAETAATVLHLAERVC